MAVADDLEQDRAALTMINPAPYNAEAPPEALSADITPVAHHYVRSNFAVPTHDGRLEIGGAVGNPTTLTLDDLRRLPAVERAVTLECAGNGRLATRPLPIGEPWGDYAVSTARWTGARLRDVLEQAQPTADGVEVRFEGADHGPYHLAPVLADTNRDDLAFVRSLALEHATDPAAEILIAYEMNGEPLTPDHGAPFRLIVPHWYAVASVKWLKRIDVLTEPYSGEFQTGHYIYEWPDRPHEPVDLMRVRARITDPAPRHDHPAGYLHRARKGVVGHRAGDRSGRQLHRRRGVAPCAARAPERPLAVAGLVARLGGNRRGPPQPARARNRRGRQRPAGGPTLEPARLREQRDRGLVRRRRVAPDSMIRARLLDRMRAAL